jgi:hypothetical protein
LPAKRYRDIDSRRACYPNKKIGQHTTLVVQQD